MPKQTFKARSNVSNDLYTLFPVIDIESGEAANLNVEVLQGEPGDVENGDVWLEDTPAIKAHILGGTSGVKLQADAERPEFLSLLTNLQKLGMEVRTNGQTISGDNSVLLVSGVGNINIPDAEDSQQKIYIFKKTDSGTTTTLVPAGGTIDGAADYDLDTQYQSVALISNGVDWFILWAS